VTAPPSSLARVVRVGLGALLTLFVLVEVNRPHLGLQPRLAIFALLGTVLAFLTVPLHPKLAGRTWARLVDGALALGAIAVYGYVVVQTEPLLRRFWIDGVDLGNRAGAETGLDTAVGIVGLVLVFEATRRTLGWPLPILAGLFLVYAAAGPSMPSWLFPHRGYGAERVVAQTFLHSQGVFGTALYVMFTYVFLFVVFGALLQATGATRWVLDVARRAFGRSAGGPAKMAVLSSGMLGSLSGSAVANTATTGTFTIPMMKDAGFEPEVAGGVEAAASSGGALIPPVMGAGAYMMLEIVDPPVTYLEVIRAALIPGILYYLSLFLIVHFQARRIGARPAAADGGLGGAPPWAGVVFGVGIATLVGVLLSGRSVFLAATAALVAVTVASTVHASTRLAPDRLLRALADAARDTVPLVVAAACVGVILGVVTLTGVGTKLPTAILGAAQHSLLPALFLLMVASLVLGMGLPSAVCYLLLATLVGPALGDLGVVPLAAHLFIFYFGMMSMVTPPVALAAYAAGSIAGAGILRTGVHAFRFALVGFTLPYMFVFRPELLLLGPDGGRPALGAVIWAVVVAVAGVTAFAAAMAGFLFAPLSPPLRAALIAAAALLLAPGRFSVGGWSIPLLDLAGGVVLTAIVAVQRVRSRAPGGAAP
jgi:TRAP transporter 4TM/12TM fusion protein